MTHSREMEEMIYFMADLVMTQLLVGQVMTPLTVEMELISLSSLVIILIILSLHLSLVYLRRSQSQEQMGLTLSPI